MSTSRKQHSARLILVLRVLAVAVILSTTALVGCGEASSRANDTGVTGDSSSEGATAFTAVTFHTEDGLTLSGRVYDVPTPTAPKQSTSWVVLCHMYPADQTSWHKEALALAELGYSALTFDFRGYGSSEGQKDIRYLDRDVTAAVGYVREAGATEVTLLGASMGGTASLLAAAELQALSSIRIAGVATLSAPVEFRGLSARQAAAEIVMPVLIVAAEDDSAADAARELSSLIGDRGELHIVAGAEHGTNIFAGAQGATVTQLLHDFVRQCMPIGG